MRFRTLHVLLLISLVPFAASTEEFTKQRPPKSRGESTRKQIDRPIRAALLTNFPPFSFLINNQLTGFTTDYIELLEQKTGLEFEIVPGTWKHNFSAFRNGRVDLITGMSFTEERSSYTLFTDPYYLLPTVVYTRKNEFQYSSIEDLKGKAVGIEAQVYYRNSTHL
ncbi:MAG: transporter substrate-binding domain-containing protein [Spirochaetia bacterium]